MLFCKHTQGHGNDLIRQEIYHFAFVAFGLDGAEQVADAMGIPSGNVLNSQSSAHDIRIAMNTVSKSIIRASQSIVGANSTSFFS